MRLHSLNQNIKGAIIMEHTKNTNDCPCANGYTNSTFMESFGKDDEELKKCELCSNFKYSDGICACSKFVDV